MRLPFMSVAWPVMAMPHNKASDFGRWLFTLIILASLACRAGAAQSLPETITIVFGEHSGGMPIVEVKYTESPESETELRDFLRTKVTRPLIFFGGNSSWLEPADGYERFKRIPENHPRRGAYVVRVMEMHIGDAAGVINAASAAHRNNTDLAEIPPGVKLAIWTKIRYGGRDVGDTLTVSYDDIGHADLRRINMRDGIFRLFNPQLDKDN